MSERVGDIGSGIVGMISAVLGLAILAVILSRGATTVSVLGTFFQGLSSLVAVAVSPITGGNSQQLAAAAAGLSATGSSTYTPVSGFGFGNIGGASTASGGGITIGGGNSNGFGSVSISGQTISNVANGIGGLFSSKPDPLAAGSGGWVDATGSAAW